MKKVISIILALMMVLPTVSAFAKYGDYSLDDIKLGEKYDYGSAFDTVALSKGTTTYQDGKPIGVTAVQGSPSKLQIIDLTTNKLIEALEIPNCTSMCWHIRTAPDGKVWFGDYNKCHLYNYDPETKKITDFGALGDGTTAVVGLCFDDEGNVWIAGNPTTILYKFDVKTNQLTKVLNKKTSNSIGMSITYHNGKIYYVILTTPAIELYAYDIKTGTEEVFPKPDSVKLFSYLHAKGDKIMMYATLATGKNGIIAFDTKTGKFTDVIDSGVASSRHFTPVIDGKVYYLKSSTFYGYDLETGEVTKAPFGVTSILRGSDEHLVEIPNNPDLPGLSYVNFQYNGGYWICNFTTGKRKWYSGMMEGTAAQPMYLRMGADNKLYLTQFMGTQALEMDIVTGDRKYFPMSQATTVAYYKDNVYFANYSEGDLRKLDKTKEYGDDNPVILKEKFITEEQQRIHSSIEADDKIVFGSFPDYNMLGGALTVFDPETEKMDIYRTSYSFTGPNGQETFTSSVFGNDVYNQSILGITYKDGKIYAGTSVSGGLGINATETVAKLFVFDLATRKMEKCIDMDFIPNLDFNIQEVSGLTIGPDGNLIGATYNVLFKLNPETLELIDYRIINSKSVYRADGQQHWYHTKFSFDKETGFYFTSIRADSSKITVFDPYTFDYVQFSAADNYPELGSDGNIYTYNGSYHILKYPVIRGDDRSYIFNNRVMLKMGSPTAIVDGTAQAIDTDPVIRPFFCYDNVMLPLRYIAELFGYSVKWNEAEQYALLYKGNESIIVTVGSRDIIVNGTGADVKAPVQPRIKDGRIFVHINTISDIIGKTLYFDKDERIMVVDKTTGSINDSELNEIFTYAKDYFKTN